MTTKRWTSAQIEDQADRVAIVTGGNSGVGYETAKALAAKGAKVFVASRSEERGTRALDQIRTEISNADVELLLLDLASLRSVKTFTETFKSKSQRLDLLINNDGVMNPPTRRETEDGFELQMGTNHLGHFALTLRLADLIIAQPGSRVVTVSSSAQNFVSLNLDDLQWRTRPYKGMQSYSASKIANLLFTLELQRRFTALGISSIATSAHPGWTATNLQATTPFFRLLNPVVVMKTWQGAQPTLYAAVSEDAKPGGYYGPRGIGNVRGYPTANKPAAQSADADLARALWAKSEELVGFTNPALTIESAPTSAN